MHACITAQLQPHFDSEESLLAYLKLIPAPEERAEKLAAQCNVTLGTAARYVQRFCAAPGGHSTDSSH